MTEVAFGGNGPVLGATTWPDDPDGLDELVAGLDDLIPKARGSMLIVGASDHEARHAHELAARFKNDWFLEQAPEQPVRVASTRPPGAPLTTPPPSGPYPVGAAGSTSTALARIPPPSPEKLARRETPLMLDLRAWDGPREGRALRRAARLADRVLVIVRSGHTTATQLHGMPKRLGREERIGYVVIGLPDELHSLHDRVGDVTAFWQA